MLLAAAPLNGLNGHVRAEFSEAGASQPSTEYEMSSFMDISSYSLPSSYDSTLSTPTSSASSPPLHIAKTRQTPPSYSTSSSTGTRNSSPKMWWPSYSLNGQSNGSSSSLSLHNSQEGSHFDLGYSEIDGSPRRVLSPTMQPLQASQPPFLPSYSLGTPSLDEERPHDMQPYYEMRDVNPNNLIMQDDQPQQLPHLDQGYSMDSKTSPIYRNNNNNININSQHHHRRASAQEFRSPMSGAPNMMSTPGAVRTVDKSIKVSPYRINKKQKGRSMSEQINRSSVKEEAENTYEVQPVHQTSDALKEEDSGDVKMPRLKAHIPDEDRYLFYLRAKYIDKKGHAMWEKMVTEYAARFGRVYDKAALQMRYSRAKVKFLILEDEYKDTLIKAVKEIERNRYKLISEYMRKECNDVFIDFTATVCEAKLVEMGIESNLFVTDSFFSESDMVRRRKTFNPKRLAKASAANGKTDSAPDSRRASYEPSLASDDLTSTTSPLNTLNEEQEEDLLQQIEQRGYDTLDIDSPTPLNLEENVENPSIAARGATAAQQSTKVARQACEEIMSNTTSPFGNEVFYPPLTNDLVMLS